MHEQVYALGGFRSVSGTGNGVTEDAVRALLAEWKQDQDALERRFDRDRDGSISLEEWERPGPRHAAPSNGNAPNDPPRTPCTCSAGPTTDQLFLLATLQGRARRAPVPAPRVSRLRRFLCRRVRARLADAGRPAECLE